MARRNSDPCRHPPRAWRLLVASALLALLLFSPPLPARANSAMSGDQGDNGGMDHGGNGGGGHGMASQGKGSSRDVTISRKRVLRKKLKKFVDPLPIPPVVNADWLPKDSNGAAALTIGAFSVKRKFHRDLPATRVYAFGLSRKWASVPGPTIVARVGSALHVTWQNNITDQQHIMPVDFTLMAPKLKLGGVPITVHLHGAQVSSSSDGHPEAWYTHAGEKGPQFESHDNHYPNMQPPSTLWYHDHTLGMTRLNMVAGLVGAYILSNPQEEKKFNLPVGRFDVPLVIQDRSFLWNGHTFMEGKGLTKAHPVWLPEYFGAFMTVNGKVTPYMSVQRRKYRFRLINAANARFLDLFLRASAPASDQTSGMSTQGTRTSITFPFVQVASEAGYLNRPVPMRRITVAPGERACIIIDFSQLPAGAVVRVKNRAPAPYPGGDLPTGDLQYVMQFNVEGGSAKDSSTVPPMLNSIPALDLKNIDKVREITLSEVEDKATGEPLTALIEKKHYSEKVDITPSLGTRELWYLINLSEDAHPIHIHFGPHRIVFRRPFNKELYEAGKCSVRAGSCYTGVAVTPSKNERGLKDTTRAPPGYVTALVVDFAPWMGKQLSFDASKGPGYMVHCHILDHEDNDMMRPFKILPAK
ncbi:hypothetical protein CLOM_g19334 [Closterium sp. NIES-68]|nr:hypothetical protein CLOM_g19334 [Closterium sp. NIES-68]GJP58960.1 hypothetical protein CLOP_g6726 [Closterium sp. NIES-67]